MLPCFTWGCTGEAFLKEYNCLAKSNELFSSLGMQLLTTTDS